MTQLEVSPGGRRAVPALIESLCGPGVRVVHDPEGAPQLIGSPLFVSISHSRNYAAVMTSTNCRCGVDIEEPRMEQLERVKEKFMSAAEIAAGVEPLTAWTAKEAVFKAAGTPGLGMSQIDLLAIPGCAVTPDGRRFALHTEETPQYTLTTALPYD